jgi:hypothetical protein
MKVKISGIVFLESPGVGWKNKEYSVKEHFEHGSGSTGLTNTTRRPRRIFEEAPRCEMNLGGSEVVLGRAPGRPRVRTCKGGLERTPGRLD